MMLPSMQTLGLGLSVGNSIGLPNMALQNNNFDFRMDGFYNFDGIPETKTKENSVCMSMDLDGNESSK